MHRFFKLSVGILWLICSRATVNGQDQHTHKVVVANNPIKGIEIKWLSKHIVSSDAIYLYRRQKDSTHWERLNNEPLRRITEKTKLTATQQILLDTLASQRSKDKALDAMIKLGNSMTPAQTMQPLVLLTLNLKALEYNTFSEYLGVYYRDTTAKLNISYQYKIVAYEKQKAKTLALSAMIKCEQYAQDKPIQEIVIGRVKNSITLKWKLEPTRFFAVNIYKKVNTNWQRANKYPVPVATSKGNLPPFFFKDDSVSIGNTYEYKIAGVDFFGHESVLSAPVQLVLKDIQAPSSATGFRASIKNQDIYFTWNKVADPDVDGLFLMMANNLDGIWSRQNVEKIAPTTTAWVLLNKLPSYYYFKLVSVDRAGNESASPAILIKITDMKAPAAPQNFKASIDTNRVKLTWSVVKESDVKGYNIYRSALKPDTNEMVLMNTTPIKANVFIDTLPYSLSNTVYYSIRTVDTALNKSKYLAAIAVVLKDHTAPQVPFIKSVVQVGSSFRINYYKATDGDTKSMELTRIHLGNIKKISVPIDSSNYLDTNLDGNGMYQYSLKALDKTGNISKPSNEFLIDWKEQIKNTNPILRASYQKTKKYIALDWKGAEVKEDMGFIVFLKINQDTYRPLSKLSKNTNFKISTLSQKGTYLLQVRQYHTDGSVGYSNTASIVIE